MNKTLSIINFLFTSNYKLIITAEMLSLLPCFLGGANMNEHDYSFIFFLSFYFCKHHHHYVEV